MPSRKKYCLAILFCLTVNTLFSQSITLLKSIPFPDAQYVSVDVNNSFYVADQIGNVFKFDSTGKEINVYSPQRPAQISLIDASKTMNLFIFYRDLQQFQILNRFLTGPYSDINREYIGYAYMVAPSLDNNLWLFDNFTFSLKKYDLSLRKVTIEAPLDLILDPRTYNINQIKEYQNKVFMNNANSGIMVFDNLGNHGVTLPFKTNYFNFAGNEIYFIEDGKLVFYDLYNEKIKLFTFEQINTWKFVLKINRKIVVFKRDFIEIFHLD